MYLRAYLLRPRNVLGLVVGLPRPVQQLVLGEPHPCEHEGHALGARRLRSVQHLVRQVEAVEQGPVAELGLGLDHPGHDVVHGGRADLAHEKVAVVDPGLGLRLLEHEHDALGALVLGEHEAHHAAALEGRLHGLVVDLLGAGGREGDVGQLPLVHGPVQHHGPGRVRNHLNLVVARREPRGGHGDAAGVVLGRVDDLALEDGRAADGGGDAGGRTRGGGGGQGTGACAFNVRGVNCIDGLVII